MTAIYNSVTELIGKTPVVKLSKIVPEDSADVFVRLESFNPGGSVKDRIALSIIEKAEHDGLLEPGDTIVEPTPGSIGIELSMVGAARGYRVIVVIPETMGIERRLLMKGYGIELILTPDADGISGSIREAERLVKENSYLLPLQFENEANPPVHEKATGPEVHQAFGVNGLDAFVAGIDTGETITGTGQGLKRVCPKIGLTEVGPAESTILEGKKTGPYKTRGIGTGLVSKALNTPMYDKVLSISGDEAMETAREVGRREGILAGISSGTATAATLKVAKELRKGKKVLAVVPDNNERYLSAALYQEM